MTLNNLDYALMALDSYNRGYNPGIGGLGVAPIGNASFKFDSGILLNDAGVRKDIGADFYAAAYQVGTDIVISYRGTDNIPVDMRTGWTTGAGHHALRPNARRGFGCGPSATGRRLLP